jgi:DNA-binding response OmpR family regulator
MLAEVTRAAGYAALTASGSGDALAVTAGRRVDLIVADTASPEAKDALRALRAGLVAGGQAGDVPVVLLTSAGHLLKATELAGLGVQLILSKPLSTRELLAAVAELLDAADPARREAA